MATLYTLRNRPVFRYLMDHPGCGTPYTVRSLANAAGCTSGLIGHLRSGRGSSCDMNAAHDIAEALGVAVLCIFMPPTFTTGTTSFLTEESID